jgi:hypothetical protein
VRIIIVHKKRKYYSDRFKEYWGAILGYFVNYNFIMYGRLYMTEGAEFLNPDRPGKDDEFNQLLPADSATVQELFLHMHGIAEASGDDSVDLSGSVSPTDQAKSKVSLVAVSIFTHPKAFEDDGSYHAATLTTFGSETDDFATAERQIWYRPGSNFSDPQYELRATEGISCTQFDALELLEYFESPPDIGGVLIDG